MATKKMAWCPLRNMASEDTHFDKLNSDAEPITSCSSQSCLGSVMFPSRHTTEPRLPAEVLKHAKQFLDGYFTSIRRLNSTAHTSRWRQVIDEIQDTGTYQLTQTELVYGAKLGWRNAVRCIGRIQWSKLQVFDCRYVTTTSGMFEALCNHIKYSTNKGNIRSAITIFPQRTDGTHDFKVWNQQLISYAGYKNPDGTIVGDPANAEFTEVCIKLGWKSARTNFDILPLVLSANGHDPDYFDIPQEYVLEIPLSHPSYPWFEDLKLKWYALPAVSGMMFDCGGLEFPATPFNGWYMSTEIGCRNLCDTHRYNMLEKIAKCMNLDTRTSVNLWKDKALVECNVAVLHSFQKLNITIVDHHTASESFIKHMENEQRLRNGCPADWIWIVPPLSGSITPVFHQEMALYHLKPSYDYQEAAWRVHIWKKGRESGNSKKSQRKFHFKQIARAVKFTSKLFGRALSRRIKATILYATETGKSESYAKKLVEIFGHAFNAQIYSMSDYDITSIEHEAMLLVVTSTFGNGDPPENGEDFAKNLYTLKMNESGNFNGIGNTNLALASSKSFIKANSQSDVATSNKKLDRLDSQCWSLNDPFSEDNFGPLSNVRFAVFGLGSSAYPNFCAFGKYVDNLLGELGGERLLKLATGDEMCGQEQAFIKWASDVFRVSCDTFCLDDDDTFLEATKALQTETLTAANVRFCEMKPHNVGSALTKCHNKKVTPSKLISKTYLHGQKEARNTLLLKLNSNQTYSPGDHVGVFAENQQDLVEKIIKRLKGLPNENESVELQILKENHTSNGLVKTWIAHEKLPVLPLKDILSRFLDITTPPAPNLLSHFAAIASDSEDRKRLNLLATDSSAYEDWRHWKYPNLLEVLEEFPSVQPNAALLCAQLNILQPRFYSVSSSPLMHSDQIHLTVAVVVYRTQDGDGPVHYGVCSNFLKNVQEGSDIYIFIRSAPSFHLPSDPKQPMILVGPGTGIAPFRAFWQQRKAIKSKTDIGRAWLFFGCRQKEMDLYRDEKLEMKEKGVLNKVFLALSREPELPKTYVQDLALAESAEIYKLIVLEKGHFYVCGDCTMAEHVYQTLKKIIQKCGKMTNSAVEEYMLSLRDENRYHEDIFGITLRTAEIHNRSRESARIKMASEPNK